MLRLTSLELERFRSFVEPAHIAFPATGLVQVCGNGSGCGKSSIFLGIADALGVCQVPATQLKSWFSDKPRRVAASFKEDKGSSFTSIRETGMSLIVDGEPVTGAPKFLNERLQSLLGVASIDWIIPLTYRAQNAGSFFLGLSDSQKKEFLSSVLGLTSIEDALEKAEEGLVEAEAALVTAQRDCESARSVRESLAVSAAECPLPSPEAKAQIEVGLVEVAAQIAAHTARLAHINSASNVTVTVTSAELQEVTALEQQINKPDAMAFEIEKRLTATESRISATMQSWAAEQRKYNAKVAAQGELRRQIERLEQELLSCNAKIEEACSHRDHIADSRCPTCSQELPDDSFLLVQQEKALRKLETDRLALERNLEALRTMDLPLTAPDRPDTSADEEIRNALRQRLEAQRKKYQSQLTTLMSQKSTIILNAQARGSEARKAYDAEAREVMAQNFEATSLRQKLVADLAAWKEKEQQALRIADRLSKADRQVMLKADDVAKAQAACTAEADFIALIGYKGFLGAIFDEVLLDISQETNRLLAMLPNVSHLSMYLTSTQTSASSKKQKKAIAPSFRAHGFEVGEAWKKVFSGGQVTAIELAIDLAVAQVVGRRTGVTPGWLVLDEPFLGVPAEEVEQIMGVLGVLAQDRLVLVVHHSQSQEAFGSTIEVFCENGRSTVKTA